jgi:hypothetical protein
LILKLRRGLEEEQHFGHQVHADAPRGDHKRVENVFEAQQIAMEAGEQVVERVQVAALVTVTRTPFIVKWPAAREDARDVLFEVGLRRYDFNESREIIPTRNSHSIHFIHEFVLSMTASFQTSISNLWAI